MIGRKNVTTKRKPAKTTSNRKRNTYMAIGTAIAGMAVSYTVKAVQKRNARKAIVQDALSTSQYPRRTNA